MDRVQKNTLTDALSFIIEWTVLLGSWADCKCKDEVTIAVHGQ
jgi:hypothetical protein